jgi:hypothetical protein
MKPNTEEIEKSKEHREKGTTKTIGNVKRVVKKRYGVNNTEADGKPKEE